MSAPDRDLDRQTKRHRGPLRGMFAVVLFALTLLLLLGVWVAWRGGQPDGAEVQVQSGLGLDVEEDGAPANLQVEADDVVLDPAVDPTAVEVPSLIVEHPQTGMTDNINPLTAPSEAAVPLDPVGEEEGAIVVGEEDLDD